MACGNGRNAAYPARLGFTVLSAELGVLVFPDIGGPRVVTPFATLLKKYLRHIGTDEFFELF